MLVSGRVIYNKHQANVTRWWQLNYFLFLPLLTWGEASMVFLTFCFCWPLDLEGAPAPSTKKVARSNKNPAWLRFGKKYTRTVVICNVHSNVLNIWTNFASSNFNMYIYILYINIFWGHFGTIPRSSHWNGMTNRRIGRPNYIKQSYQTYQQRWPSPTLKQIIASCPWTTW